MAVTVIPDAEALIGAWLREHDDIIDLDARVAGRTPNSTTMPWIRVTQLDAPPIARARQDHHIDYMIQLDCYAGATSTAAHTAQAEASTLGRTARAVLKALEGTVTDGVAVNRVRVTTHIRDPDTALEPARERVIIVADVLMHPV